MGYSINGLGILAYYTKEKFKVGQQFKCFVVFFFKEKDSNTWEEKVEIGIYKIGMTNLSNIHMKSRIQNQICSISAA